MRVLVLGKAKTGTTATVSLIRQSLEPCELVMEPGSVLGFAERSRGRQGNEAIKILWEHFRGRRRHLDAIVHAEFGFAVDKVVFISRDARDEMVSKLLYHAKIARDDNLTPEPKEQVTARWVAALEAKERDPGSISFRGLCRIFESLYDIDLWAKLTDVTDKRAFESYIHAGVDRDRYVLAYEDLVADRTAGLADYLGVPVSVPAAEVDLGRFGHTRRSGRAANWRHFFTAEDVEILRPLLAQMLPGDQRYEDWELAGQARLDPAEVSGYVARIAAA
jgi:hypothetical protein